MSVRMRIMDDPEVGQGGGDFFSPNSQRQRIALIPCFVSKRELEIPAELRKKAQEGDFTAVQEVEDMEILLKSLKDGMEKEPPTVVEMKEPDPGYLFARTDSHGVHYFDATRYILCKRADYERAGREPTCCVNDKKNREPLLMYACVLLVYDTDPEGNVIKLPSERQVTIDEKSKLDFKYRLKTWTLADNKMKEWKKYHRNFPPINSDYEVWTEKQGTSDRIKFSPCNEAALWTRRGPGVVKKVIKEGAAKWADIGEKLGKNSSMKEIDDIFGINAGQRRGSGGSERNFQSILGS